MSETAEITLRVSQDLKDKIDLLAAKSGRSPSEIVQRELSNSIDHQFWVLEEIEKGREDFRQGRTVPHDEVMMQIDAILDRYKRDAA